MAPMLECDGCGVGRGVVVVVVVVVVADADERLVGKMVVTCVTRRVEKIVDVALTTLVVTTGDALAFVTSTISVVV